MKKIDVVLTAALELIEAALKKERRRVATALRDLRGTWLRGEQMRDANSMYVGDIVTEQALVAVRAPKKRKIK